MAAADRTTLYDAHAIAGALDRMAAAILGMAEDAHSLVLVGVQRRGVDLAGRLATLIEQTAGQPVARGAVDITLYRDDLQTVGPTPIVGETNIPIDLTAKIVIIIDDVLYTGRTVRAALAELSDFGRPARVGLAILIDRGGRELPIQADIVGETVECEPGDQVAVLVAERDGRDAVELIRGAAG